jgi:hypothetical protein
MPVPQDISTPTDNHEVLLSRNKHILWKLKGIAGKATYRIFVKYGQPPPRKNDTQK